MLRTIIRNLLKPLSFLPAVFLMYMIFSFSAQDGTTSAQLSYKVSYKIVETGGKILGADFEPWEIENLANRFHGPVRKLAHMTEYFALAVSVAFPLYVYGLRGILLMIIAGLFCVGFACADEYHQSLVAGRSPSEKDVAIDSIGIFFGIIFTRIVSWTGRKTIFRPLAKKKHKDKKGQNDQNPTYPPNGYAGVPPYMNQPYYNDPRFQNTQQQHYDPRFQTAPQQHYDPRFQNAPQQHYDPRFQNAPQHGYPSNGYNGMPYSGTPSNGYSGVPYSGSPYPQPPYENPAQPRSEAGTSDQLSEDMSFKKLMNDLKDKKQTEHHLSHKPKLKKTESDLSALNTDTFPTDDPDLEIEEIHFKS